MEDIDGGLHPAVDGQSQDEDEMKMKMFSYCRGKPCPGNGNLVSSSSFSSAFPAISVGFTIIGESFLCM